MIFHCVGVVFVSSACLHCVGFGGAVLVRACGMLRCVLWDGKCVLCICCGVALAYEDRILHFLRIFVCNCRLMYVSVYSIFLFFWNFFAR